MFKSLKNGFYRLVLDHPVWVIAGVLALLVAAGFQARHFELDASAESLMLQDDKDLLEYRKIRDEFGADNFLFVTYNPQEDLFSDASLIRLSELQADLQKLDRVGSVLSILNAPLLNGLTLDDLPEGIRTLRDEGTDREAARAEFRNSPLYRNLLMNQEADTTAMVVNFKQNERIQNLLRQREQLRLKRDNKGLDKAEARKLAEVKAAYARLSDKQQALMEKDIASIRDILDKYRDSARIHLGGVPMIAVDMINFVRDDIKTFGVGVGLFIILLLFVTFRRLRWVALPSLICASVVVAMVGWIGFMGWPVTVVSSNFISLVLIITLSLIVHLVVRYRELHADDERADQRELLKGVIDSKFKPSFFTAFTTMVSFASLMFVDIKPVMDFGLMMVWSVVAAFVFSILLFPALAAPFRPGRKPELRRDYTARANLWLARRVRRFPRVTWAVSGLLILLGVVGALQLTVENRFIDYFHEDTEIYQGMLLIDRELGGTTPLDVVLDAPQSFYKQQAEDAAALEEFELSTEPSPTDGYWYTNYNLPKVERIHEYIANLDATGKVLSMGTLWKLVVKLNNGEPLDTFELAVLYKRLPDDLRKKLVAPYMSENGNQVRIGARIIDSDPDLRRDALLERIRTEIPKKFDVNPEQLTLSGMLVLYNNVMQSLLRSQIVTLVVVFSIIAIMFWGLYRSLRMALIGPVPTLAASAMVLGIMGWLGIPLDIMTMTIAAIVIGIGVHDTIHYTDRFRKEVAGGASYADAMITSHRQVGRAMVYTTVIVTLGFSILTLSNFMPTIYFGLLTGLAMIFALISNMTLLPLLLEKLKPFDGPVSNQSDRHETDSLEP